MIIKENHLETNWFKPKDNLTDDDLAKIIKATGAKYKRLPVPKQTRMLRSAEEAPEVPTSAKELAEQEHKFPYQNASVINSAIMYWTVNRFTKHRLDYAINVAAYKKMAFKYSAFLFEQLGGKWEDHKHYIDWYLASRDKFITEQCNYGFDYMVSASCYNKFLAEKPVRRNGKPEVFLSIEEYNEWLASQERND